MIGKFFRGLWQGITWVRVALANLLFILLLVVLYVALTDRPQPLPERAALLVNPVGRVVDERTRVSSLALLEEADAASREVLLADLIESIDYAREDDRIVALVMDLGGLMSIGMSKTSELAEALARFRATGKPMVAVGDYFSQDQYRLAVEADTLLMHPFGAVLLEGFGVFDNYFAEALEKFSVSMHVFRAGEFKSIAEPYLRSDMSPGEREVTREWLTDLWTLYGATIEQRRDLQPGGVDSLIENYNQRLDAAEGNTGQLALDAGLIDDLLDRNQQNEFISALVGARGDDGGFEAVQFEHYLSRTRPQRLLPPARTVAIVTAQGDILPGDRPPGSIGGDSLARLLRETADRPQTEAIVLRINSGGGSVFASEIIREEIQRIRETGTPVIASFGSVAASGGYYIATAADRIIATEPTITGSIGVFAAFPTFERLLARGGVYTDGVGTTSMAGGLRPDRGLSPQVAEALQRSVDSIYEDFLTLVMDARGLDREAADAIAQGRVLSAADAMEAGLVDSLGSLDSAVAEAAALAGLDEDDYEVISIEPRRSPRDLLLQELSDILGTGFIGELGAGNALARWVAPLRRNLEFLNNLEDPRHLYMHCLVCAL